MPNVRSNSKRHGSAITNKLKKDQKIAPKNLNDLSEYVSGETSMESVNVSELSELDPSGELSDGIAPKNLKIAVSEYVSGEISMESVNVSKVSKLDPSGKLSDGFSKRTPDPDFSPSPVTSQLIQCSNVIPTENQKPVLVSSTHGEFSGDRESKISSLEVELLVNFLRKATTQVLSSSEGDHESKKLFQALLEMVIEMLQTVPEEKSQIDELLSSKTRMFFTCLLLFVLAMVTALYFTTSPRSSFGKPPPT